MILKPFIQIQIFVIGLYFHKSPNLPKVLFEENPSPPNSQKFPDASTQDAENSLAPGSLETEAIPCKP